MLPLFCLVLWTAPEKPDREATIKAARTTLAALVQAARANQRRGEPLTGDALTEHLVRAAASAALHLPEAQRSAAFLVAIGVGLDSSAALRSNPVTGSTWRRLESDAERGERLRVLGKPTMHGRHDLAQHFAVSAALTALFNAKTAEAIGIAKELLDASGGSGFSFADLAADLAGVALAGRLVASADRLEAMARTFRVAQHVLPPRGLEEGLSAEQLERRFGSPRDERFRKAVEALRARVLALPGYHERKKQGTRRFSPLPKHLGM